MSVAAGTAVGWPQLALAAAAGFALALAARQVHCRVRGFLPEDEPLGPRKLHARATPLGGFLHAGAAALWLLACGEGAIAGALAALAGVGWLDDRGKAEGGIPWRARAVVQLAAAGLIAGNALPRADPATWLAAVAFTFVLINAVNFLDNMNGVATALAGLGVLLATGGTGPLAAAGALWLGFLPCNWPRAQLFLGDGGALPLGALLAAAALRGAATAGGVTSWLLLAAPAFVPLLDFVQVIAARLWLGYAPWVGDRRHLSHVAHYLGVPQVAVMPLLAALALAAWALARAAA